MQPEDKKFLEVRDAIQQLLGTKYTVIAQHKLPYQVVFYSIDEEARIKTYKTDLLILKKNIPLVVIEGKLGNATTHDLLTYSEKANQHKSLFPYLKYGMLILSDKHLTLKHIEHGNTFDFIHMIQMDELENFVKRILRPVIRDAERIYQYYS